MQYFKKEQKMKKLTIFILSCILFTNCDLNKDKTCYLIGKVIDRDSKSLILKKQTVGSRGSTNRDIMIEIDSTGSFKYALNSPFIEAYELIFNDELEGGAWRPILFFPDNDTIQFILYPIEKAESNKIIGSRLSLEGNKFKQKYRNTFSNQFTYWYQKKDSLDNINETNSDFANVVSDTIDSLYKEVANWELRYVWNKPSLFGYSKFITILRNEKDSHLIPIDTLKKCYSLFQQKFPHHPYNLISQYRINGLENITVGGFYVDFTAPDSNGTNITLSNYISKTKLTLIDLWAPWCGPCIRKSKKVIPILEEFKDSGFAVIGVVGEISSKEQFNKAIEKHKYPWTILSEISNENNLWEKYNISKSGGSQFLVDKKGNILAINPTPDELKEFIMKE